MECLDKGIPVDVVYLDFQKAFDEVSHAKLNFKLRKYCISGKISEWIKSWLKQRRQRVVLHDKASEWEAVLSGVPHGSVLGPVLFIIYIDDIDNEISSMLLKFADDTKLIKEVGSDASFRRMQTDLDNLFEWVNKGSMAFNIEKCGVMHFGPKNVKHEYSLGNRVLKSVNCGRKGSWCSDFERNEI